MEWPNVCGKPRDGARGVSAIGERIIQRERRQALHRR